MEVGEHGAITDQHPEYYHHGDHVRNVKGETVAELHAVVPLDVAEAHLKDTGQIEPDAIVKDAIEEPAAPELNVGLDGNGVARATPSPVDASAPADVDLENLPTQS